MGTLKTAQDPPCAQTNTSGMLLVDVEYLYSQSFDNAAAGPTHAWRRLISHENKIPPETWWGRECKECALESTRLNYRTPQWFRPASRGSILFRSRLSTWPSQ